MTDFFQERALLMLAKAAAEANRIIDGDNQPEADAAAAAALALCAIAYWLMSYTYKIPERHIPDHAEDGDTEV